MNFIPPASDEQQSRGRRRLFHDPPRRQRLIFSFSLLSLASVSLLAYLVEQLPVIPFDLLATRELQAIRNTLFLRFMIFSSLFGFMPWVSIVITGGVLVVSALRGWRDGAYLLALTAVESGANQLIKQAIGRPRPPNTLVEVFMPLSGASFPSGHVMFYTVFFGFLCFLAWRHFATAFWRAVSCGLTGSLIVAVGPSRIYLGAHWLSDVIAAYLVGSIILAFGIEFHLRDLAPLSATTSNHKEESRL